MNGMTDILLNFEDGIKILTINLPKKRNPLSPENAIRIAEEVEKSSDDGTRVIILTGAGGAFCAGAQLDDEEFNKDNLSGQSLEAACDEMISTSYHRLAKAVHQVPRPVIAAVDGVAAGFGCSLALIADLTLASTNARFVQVFVNIALIPDGGSSYILPKLIGMKKAMELAFTGEPVDAEEALQLNIINRIYPPEELMAQSLQWAHRLAEGPVHTMGVAKKTLYDTQKISFEEALDMESRRQARLMTQPNFFNAVAAFLQKKKPTFL